MVTGLVRNQNRRARLSLRLAHNTTAAKVTGRASAKTSGNTPRPLLAPTTPANTAITLKQAPAASFASVASEAHWFPTAFQSNPAAAPTIAPPRIIAINAVTPAFQ